jgi:hypothetical protein
MKKGRNQEPRGLGVKRTVEEIRSTDNRYTTRIGTLYGFVTFIPYLPYSRRQPGRNRLEPGPLHIKKPQLIFLPTGV